MPSFLFVVDLFEFDAAAAAASPRAQPVVKSSCRYEKIEAVGAGAFGVVYRARDRRTGEIVAMKCLNADDFDDGRLGSMFADEVGALEACLGVPCVVQLRDACRRDPATGEAFIVMEFVGPALSDAARDGGDRRRGGGGARRHTEGEARRIARQLLAGAAGMHAAGLMHRDLKPDNVLVDARGGGLKIGDLGKSRAVAVAFQEV